MRYPAALTIPIELRRDQPQPLYQQIAGQLGTAVEEGRLATGTALPSTRTLGSLLGVSRGVVATAYDLLSDRGYLRGRPGSGSYVAVPAAGVAVLAAGGAVPAAPERPARPAGPDAPVDLRPGGPGPDLFPLRQWRAAWRRASFGPPPAQPPPPLGLPELRRAIAVQLRDTRGTALAGTELAGTELAGTELAGTELVVTTGTGAGLRLVLDALRLAGDQVAIEELVPPPLRRAVPAGPGPPVALPVDAAGARLDRLPPGCRAVVVSPDAHDPLGYPLSADRRRQAAAWATGSGGWLVEVACDTGFRPQACRLPRLATLAGGATAVVGGFGSLLTPGLGIGYALVPAELAGPLRRLVADRGAQPPYLPQRVLAELLAGGTVTRLMHRLGRAYRRKQRLLAPALAPVGRLAGLAGLGSAVLYLPGGRDGPATAAALHRRGVRVRPLADYHAPGHPPGNGPAGARSGLVIGYGHLPDPQLRTGLARLARELAALR
jgi:GntR family transcriptional regulator/MocR family aminotransferase